MLKWLPRRLRRKCPQQTEAYQLGQQAGLAISDDVESTTDDLLSSRRLDFLAVLDGRLEGIKDVHGATNAEQAQIEFRVMLENWSERMADQEAEVWNTVAQRWPSVLIQTSGDLLHDLIRNRVGWHYTQLVSDGLEHAANAVAPPAGPQRE